MLKKMDREKPESARVHETKKKFAISFNFNCLQY
jgi:hypothetical protein